MAIIGARGEDHRITPHLVVRDAERAVDFYERALGAVELYRSPLPGGAGMHFHLRIGRTMVMVTDEMPERAEDPGSPSSPLRSPKTLGATTMVLELFVDDVDAAYERAVRAGGEPTLPVSDTFWGDRYGWITDPFGHVWALATVKEEITPEEIARRLVAMAAGAAHEC